MKNNEMSDLERIARKCEEMIYCEIPKNKCEVKGDYWKCYMGNYIKCKIYLDWLIERAKE